MNNIQIYLLKALRKAYKLVNINNIFNYKDVVNSKCESDADEASNMIYKMLITDVPCMIARFGAFELSIIINYLNIKNSEKNFLNYIKGIENEWWWNQSLINSLKTNAGFFPPTIHNIEKFCKLMLDEKNNVDILASWLDQEKYLADGMHAKKIRIILLDPFWSTKPWTLALKDKKILVVHPFIETIKRQYKNREFLFKNKNILPKFKSLNVIKAVQSIGEGDNRFLDWFEALEYMKSEIDKIDYDICLIGAGAYGFPLAAHVKRKGKKSIHMGGSLQLLFGIRGKRWEAPEYGVGGPVKKNDYLNLINKYWVRPNENEKPNAANDVEGACYW